MASELPPNLLDSYQLVFGLSVTEMEIVHAAYRIENPNGRGRDVGRMLGHWKMGIVYSLQIIKRDIVKTILFYTVCDCIV